MIALINVRPKYVKNNHEARISKRSWKTKEIKYWKIAKAYNVFLT